MLVSGPESECAPIARSACRKPCSNSFIVLDPATVTSHKLPQTWEEACELLVQGDRDFAEMTDSSDTHRKTRVIPFDPQALGWGVGNGGAPVQASFAAVLGCADARVPTGPVFSKGCSGLVVVRVAGNVLGQECLGLRYAIIHFPSTLKLLVLLGHAKCSAIPEAVTISVHQSGHLHLFELILTPIVAFRTHR